ncbi:MAG: type II secretion system protein [bacterium]|nr:type II secretion system protein [bacterium]
MFCKRKIGFTLIELVVVMAIAALLSAILLPVFGNVRENSRQAGCISNLHSILIALKVYALDNNGTLPPRDLDYAGALYQGNYISSESSFKCPNDYELTDAGGVDLSDGVERFSYNKYRPGLEGEAPESETGLRLLTDKNSLAGWYADGIPYPFCGVFSKDHNHDTGSGESKGKVIHGNKDNDGAASVYLVTFADGTVRKYRNNGPDMPTAMK